MNISWAIKTLHGLWNKLVHNSNIFHAEYYIKKLNWIVFVTMFEYIIIPNLSGECLAILLHIIKVPWLNLGLQTIYSDIFLQISSVIPGSCWNGILN
jgi:hypothetical protein